MRTIKFLLQKEFLQIFRNKAMLPLIFVMPIIQLLILANAATFEIKNIKFSVADFDQSTYSRELISKFTASNYFINEDAGFSTKELENDFLKNKTRLIINIPYGFEKEYRNTGKTNIQLIVSAEDASAANIIYNYSSGIVRQFNSHIIIDAPYQPGMESYSMINVTFQNWYNPLLNYKTFMVPGILVVLVTMVGMFLTGMNIAREKEIGTIEQINVSPIKKYQFITGKLLPFWIIGLVELNFGMLVGKVVFNIPFVGSYILLILVAAIYLVLVLSIGLFISTVTDTQQQAMFIAWFCMVIFLLLGGIFTPIESMPMWTQYINYFNPVAYFNKVIRLIMLKGANFKDIYNILLILGIYAAAIMALAIFRYKKVS